jgi:hypothetical protein
LENYKREKTIQLPLNITGTEAAAPLDSTGKQGIRFHLHRPRMVAAAQKSFQRRL